eukprot:CAMPEP_0197192334 /NCGR_PEP_ID=MMETSP1423-20130617/24885_1 /TAXON_ID=476441 /ORGANISM="Pseudo-nitzschia heimii, Strain UNC1101" /LENGTH=434 /DNA_ID=CAMNT_0042645195 /DNA_START=96 /DNA_END=1396 /DNA_ORIENTATION=+
MIIDTWNQNYGNEEILDFDISNWPSPVAGCLQTLKLESVIDCNSEGKNRSRARNLIRLEKAQERKDVVNLSIHYGCCMDSVQMNAIINLLTCDERCWVSFTMVGINDTGNFYSPRTCSKELKCLFQGIKHVRILRLRSSTLNRGHGLELLLERIPSFTSLEELHLEGWQIDRVSASTLIKSLGYHTKESIHVLSMRSCRFMGENSFDVFCRGLKFIGRLNSLDVSYCNLDDNDIIPLIGTIKRHPAIEKVDLEKNCCRTQSSVNAIAKLMSDNNCKIQTLNIGTLWTGFSNEGLVQRFADPKPLFSALQQNSSLCDLNVSENYLEDNEIEFLSKMLLLRNNRSNLRSLDVRVNPFNENGAVSLLQLVRDVKTVQSIKFENSFIRYECAQLIKFQVEINYIEASLGKKLDIPLSLWPNVFARIQQGTKINQWKNG